MTLDQLSDQDLHLQTLALLAKERYLLTEILHHLKEIERRRLFSDFACSSLFDYAVKKLGYSEGQAQRRIQAMRLMKEIPEVEKKIADGSLSLSNIAQAQTAFNEMKRQNNNQPVDHAKKKDVLSKMENKSAREGQRELLKILPQAAAPKERERQVDDSRTEIKFVIDDDLRQKLEQIRSLIGPKGVKLSYAELLSQMAEMALNQLKAKAFGKKRVAVNHVSEIKTESLPTSTVVPTPAAATMSMAAKLSEAAPTSETVVPTPAAATMSMAAKLYQAAPTSEAGSAIKGRYIPAKIKHAVWQRDRGQCCKCGNRRNLNYDHIVPLAKHGPTSIDNLRLLCFQCNQRAAIKEFGLHFMGTKTRNSG